MPRAGELWDGASHKPSSLQESKALCKTKLWSAKDLGLSWKALGKQGQLGVIFFYCLFVSIYLLSLHENFGQKQMQGHAEKKQNGFGWEILVCWIMLVGSIKQTVNTRMKNLYPTLPFLVFFSLSAMERNKWAWYGTLLVR